jgi:predicted helicase
MTPLQSVLQQFRSASASEREKGTYFEELILCYLRNEATYKDLYSDVWTYADWAKAQGLDQRDVGIDLVAKTSGTGEFHAIQCKLYAADIDSFFTASGKKPFTHRIIVSTTAHWSEHADEAIRDQQPPVSKIDLFDLENSQIDWAKYKPKSEPVLRKQKELLPHQVTAVDKVVTGLASADRGKLIMACGTGKTFTSLRIAEQIAGRGKRVLFLVPSLALLSQALTDWTQEARTSIHSFAVCSDSDVGKKRKKDDDSVQTFTHELRYPATTNAKRLAEAMAKRHDSEHMTVVFSTYHSIDVVGDAQAKHGLPEFDLVICDEAHRTTGATFGDEDESSFVKVHDNGFLAAHKRLYMTATPRIYGDTAKAVAERENVALCSMDDTSLYGEELWVITFSEAVKRGLLVDYKVIVLAVEESHVNRRLQRLLTDENNQLKVDDAAKIIGCWKALAKQGFEGPDAGTDPMQRAVAFCQVIEISRGAKTHKVSSKQIAGMFQAVVEAYQAEEEDDSASTLACEAEHVDGSMTATEKEQKLAWLKAPAAEDTCRILSNVRCLSEGVDVPALDAVLFLTPRNSQVDVVQSVGRVMRNAPGKKLGYIILPVVIPAGVEPHEALNDNKTYAVVWQVLQALRSHDDRFDAMVNKLDLIGKDTSKMEVIAVTEKIQRKQKTSTGPKNKDAGRGGFTIGEPQPKPYRKDDQHELQFEIGEIEKAIYAKLVQKVGNRQHWEDWANDIAKIARTHIDRIRSILGLPPETEGESSSVQPDPGNDAKTTFIAFAKELRADLNDSITDGEIVEMLAQHLITKPVFDALFDDYSFASKNPMSLAMECVLHILQEHRLEKETDTLQSFYDSVKLRASGIDSAMGKQKIVVELYDKFFRNAFPKMTERLGIVYTPVEVVDFIIHSVADVLEAEFGQTLGSRGVHIIDPFTGTGTFITRLLQSGLIKPEELRHKYLNEIHANEIVLLAYYIAAINVEAAYHSIVGGEYQPFEGICLTDTFEMYERDDLLSTLMVDNSERRKRQKTLDIRVIIANPPYSIGQTAAADAVRNTKYLKLDERIRGTYAARSSATLKNALYDSYVRAIRWASDRIGEKGVIGFVTNGGFLDGNTADGLRKCLAEEFSDIYVVNLRGNARSSGEMRRREKDNVFGSGSRAPVAISILVKNPAKQSGTGRVFYRDIGDYLSREDKLLALTDLYSIANVRSRNLWTEIVPNEHGDWISQRREDFSELIPLGAKDESNPARFFTTHSNGIKTNRDAWVFNYSLNKLKDVVADMVSYYNAEVQRYQVYAKSPAGNDDDILEAFLNLKSPKLSWTRELKADLKKGHVREVTEAGFVKALYRPFTKCWLYFDRHFNNTVYQMPKLFPSGMHPNRVICVSGPGSITGFTALMADVPVELCVATMKGGSQCFPLYVYEATNEQTLFTTHSDDLLRCDGVDDAIVLKFEDEYRGRAGPITKEDIFYYVYGVLHSLEYRELYQDSLRKELPRVPVVRNAESFRLLSAAGRSLADLHTGYESVPMHEVRIEDSGKQPSLSVRKMEFGKTEDGSKDRSVVIYNETIKVSGIPLSAYEYVVNGRSAIEWVMERQTVRIDKDSGIVNDANDWATETMENPRYPLELLQRVITVSLETMKIVKSLPALDIADGTSVDIQPIRTVGSQPLGVPGGPNSSIQPGEAPVV